MGGPSTFRHSRIFFGTFLGSMVPHEGLRGSPFGVGPSGSLTSQIQNKNPAEGEGSAAHILLPLLLDEGRKREEGEEKTSRKDTCFLYRSLRFFFPKWENMTRLTVVFAEPVLRRYRRLLRGFPRRVAAHPQSKARGNRAKRQISDLFRSLILSLPVFLIPFPL